MYSNKLSSCPNCEATIHKHLPSCPICNYKFEDENQKEKDLE